MEACGRVGSRRSAAEHLLRARFESRPLPNDRSHRQNRSANRYLSSADRHGGNVLAMTGLSPSIPGHSIPPATSSCRRPRRARRCQPLRDLLQCQLGSRDVVMLGEMFPNFCQITVARQAFITVSSNGVRQTYLVAQSFPRSWPNGASPEATHSMRCPPLSASSSYKAGARNARQRAGAYGRVNWFPLSRSDGRNQLAGGGDRSARHAGGMPIARDRTPSVRGAWPGPSTIHCAVNGSTPRAALREIRLNRKLEHGRWRPGHGGARLTIGSSPRRRARASLAGHHRRFRLCRRSPETSANRQLPLVSPHSFEAERT